MEAKRYNPLIILFDIWSLIKNSFIFVIYLFIIKASSQSAFIIYGRMLFALFLAVTIVKLLLKWFFEKYRLDEQSFHLYKGIFNKSERTIPFSKIQNVNRHTSLLHRLLKVTSLHFETGIAGEDATVEFEVISKKEADFLEQYVKEAKYDSELAQSDNETDTDYEETVALVDQTTVHFKPTKQDVLKASFTSLSFFLLIPILGSLYYKAENFFEVEKLAEGIFKDLLQSWLLLGFIIILLVIISVIFGIVRTYLKYGNYEISSDDERIYIKKGVLEETAFSISKDRVQAIEVNQSFMKRILRLAEVKLISAGSLELEDDNLEVSVLYPFLPEKRAYEMIREILPSYEVTEQMNRLPKKSFWIRLFKPSWFWLIVTVSLLYFKPNLFQIEQSWWLIPIIHLLIIIISRSLDYANTRYIMKDNFIQFKTGSFTTTLFITKREKIIEIEVSHSLSQKLFKIASIRTINRAKPVHYEGVDDIPLEMANNFYKWYSRRLNEIELEVD